MTPSKPITVLLAEDHAIVRQGLSMLLSAEAGLTIIGQAQNGQEAVVMAAELQPDVILMDIAMPVLNGLEATRQILTANPSAKVVILSAHNDDVYVERMIEAGVAGFIEKQTSAEILTKAIFEVARGEHYFSRAIAKRLSDEKDMSRGRTGEAQPKARRLTSREVEVLQLVAEGAANKQVAGKLGISIKTVEKHRQHLMDKLGIHDTAGLTRYAISTGVIENNVQLKII
jgi:DNA-binding NarL/FixJ family response regulator